MIPLCDLTRQYAALKHEIDHAMQSVAAEGHYILGPHGRALEREIAEYCGCRHAVGVGNGTDALHLALRALRIGPGDEVITTPFSFIATTEAIGMVGATPVFADIDPLTFNIDPAQIERAITAKTKAIIPVHLYGQPCDMDRIMAIARQFDLAVVEDCAQAIGATYRGRPVGSFGDAGCLSFFPSKNLGCLGDGGMVVCNSAELSGRVEMLRRHGGRIKYQHEELGINSRLDELQAAVLRVKLKHLPQWNRLRRKCAYAYNQMLECIDAVKRPHELTVGGGAGHLAGRADGCDAPLPPAVGTSHSAGVSGVEAVYHQYTILVENRDALSRRLLSCGVANAVYYPIPLHLQEVHSNLAYRSGAFPHAEHVAQSCLSLPIFPELSEGEQSRVVEVLMQLLRERTIADGKTAEPASLRKTLPC